MIPIIRPAEPADIPAILVMAEELHGRRNIPIPFEADYFEASLRAMIQDKASVLLDVQEDSEAGIVGFVLAAATPCPFNRGKFAMCIARSGCAGVIVCSAPESQEQFARALCGGGFKSFEVNFYRSI